MAKWYVTIEEKLTYDIVVEADTDIAAEEAAYNSDKFINSDWDDNDSEVTQVGRAWEAVGEEKYRIERVGNDSMVERVSDGLTVALFPIYDDAVAYKKAKEAEEQ